MTEFETDRAAGFETEVEVFGKLQNVIEAPDFHQNYECLYTEVEGRSFCPSTPDKCRGCEQSSREDMSFIEVIYDKKTGDRVEASYHTNLGGREKTTNLSTCCLAQYIDRPWGFICTQCQEEF